MERQGRREREGGGEREGESKRKRKRERAFLCELVRVRACARVRAWVVGRWGIEEGTTHGP